MINTASTQPATARHKPGTRPLSLIDRIIVFQDLGVSSPRSHANKTAVDIDCLSGHKGGVIACQKRNYPDEVGH